MNKIINEHTEMRKDGLFLIQEYKNGVIVEGIIEPSETYIFAQKKIEDEEHALSNKTVSNMIRVNKDEYENLLKDVEIIKEVLMENALKEAGLNA